MLSSRTAFTHALFQPARHCQPPADTLPLNALARRGGLALLAAAYEAAH